MNEYLKNAFSSRRFFFSVSLYIKCKFGLLTKFTVSKMQMESIYLKYVNSFKRYPLLSKKETTNCGESNVIWIYWDKGLNNAPELVQKTYLSIKKHKPLNWSIRLLDDSNFLDYCSIPEYVLKYKETNKLSKAAFSDILRLSLLSQNGGLWLDSTCLLIDDIPDYVLNSDFFVFKSGFNDLEIPNFQSWFMRARPHNFLIDNTLEILLAEVKKEENSHTIFLCFFVFSLSQISFQTFGIAMYYHMTIFAMKCKTRSIRLVLKN